MASEILTAITRVSLPTTAGLFDIKQGGISWTPKAALFLITTATADDASASTANWGMGACDGSKQWAFSARSKDGGFAVSDVDGSGTLTNCGFLINPGNKNVNGEFAFDSFGPAVVRVNITNAFSSANFVTAAFFGGADINVDVDTISVTGGSTTNVESPGFAVDLVIFGAMMQELPDRQGIVVNSFNEVNIQSFNVNLGFAARNSADVSALTQGGISMEEEVAAPGLPINVVSDAAAVRRTRTGSDLFTVSAFDSVGFSVASDADQTHVLGYLAIEIGDRKMWVDNYTTPTATGSTANTDPTFKPQFMMHLMSQIATLNADQDTSANGAGTIGAMFIGPTADVNTSIQTLSTAVLIEDDPPATTTNTASHSDNRLNLPDDDQTTGIRGDFTQFDANGWTFNYTDVKGTGRQFIGLAIEETGAAGPTAQAVLASQDAATAVVTPRGNPLHAVMLAAQAAATAVLTIKVLSQNLLASQDTAIAIVTGRYNKKPQAMVASQDFATAAITRRFNPKIQALTASQDSATAALTAELLEALQVNMGAIQAAATAVLQISKRPLFALASQNTATAVLERKLNPGHRVVLASQDSATAVLTTVFQPSRAMLAVQASATAVLNTQLITGDFTNLATSSILDDIIEQFDSDTVPSGYRVRWEAHIKVTSGTYRVRLFNVTANTEVAGTILEAPGGTITRVITAADISGALANVVAGVPNEYRVQENVTVGTGTVTRSHLIAEPV